MQRSFPTLAPLIYLPRWALRGEESEGLESSGEVFHVLRVLGGFRRQEGWGVMVRGSRCRLVSVDSSSLPPSNFTLA